MSLLLMVQCLPPNSYDTISKNYLEELSSLVVFLVEFFQLFGVLANFFTITF